MALPVGVVSFGGDSPGGSLPTAPRGHRDSRAQVTGRPLPVARMKDAIRLHGSTRVITGSCHIVLAAGRRRTRPGPGRLSRKRKSGARPWRRRGHGKSPVTAVRPERTSSRIKGHEAAPAADDQRKARGPRAASCATYRGCRICRFLQTVYCQGLRYDVMCTVC